MYNMYWILKTIQNNDETTRVMSNELDFLIYEKLKTEGYITEPDIDNSHNHRHANINNETIKDDDIIVFKTLTFKGTEFICKIDAWFYLIPIIISLIAIGISVIISIIPIAMSVITSYGG